MTNRRRRADRQMLAVLILSIIGSFVIGFSFGLAEGARQIAEIFIR
jgi:hypothetical protein